jgi:hypothetical protein
MKRVIKRIDEQFAQSINGDGFNSSNGVFKVNYKAYTDLSLAVGRDADPSLLVKDSVFQIGDIVKGKVKGKSKKVEGEIIETSKSTDGKSYLIKIQAFKDKTTYTLIPGSIEFCEDRGNTKNVMGMGISSREKNAQNLKYNGGNIIWGSLENKLLDHPYTDVEGEPVEGPMGTGWKIRFVDDIPQDNLIFNSVLATPEEKLMSFSRSAINGSFKELLKAAEAFCYFCYHPELSEEPIDLKALLAVLFLELKNEMEPKKQMIHHFPHLCDKSYGECKDTHSDKAKSIINRFL